MSKFSLSAQFSRYVHSTIYKKVMFVFIDMVNKLSHFQLSTDSTIAIYLSNTLTKLIIYVTILENLVKDYIHGYIILLYTYMMYILIFNNIMNITINNLEEQT